MRDLWTYAGAILVVAILLWIAKVRPSKEQSTNTNEEKVDIEEIAPSPIVCESKSSEDPSRFMPKSSVVLQPQPTGSTGQKQMTVLRALSYLQQVLISLQGML